MKLALTFVVACLLFAQSIFGQAAETLAEKSQRMAWWKEAKFGLFIHWGVYSVAAGEYNGQTSYGEWLMQEAKIPTSEYEKLPPQFNPTQFDADVWVRMAKNAGMKYIVITSKHHDGFCMYKSKVSKYDIVDRTPFGRDPLRELAEACRKEGIKLCFYYSIMDWHHPDANKEDFEKYRDKYLLPQLKELLTNYGDIGVLWFDGEWIEEWTEAQGVELYQYVRTLQPNIIVNNRVGKGRNGMQGMNNSAEAVGDFGTPEQEILGEKSNLDWESCMTMNTHWGYNRSDKNYKSSDELIWNLADIAAKGGNFLLNVGPTAEGLFPPESVDRLKKMGDWMAINAEAIYASKSWVHWHEGERVRYVTGKNDEVFVFFRGYPETLNLKKISPTVGSQVTMLGVSMPLTWQQSGDEVVISLPPVSDRPLAGSEDPTWVLRMTGKAEAVTEPPIFGSIKDKNTQTFVFADTASIDISAEFGAVIYYATDGTEPTTQSAIYQRGKHIATSMTIRAMAKNGTKKPSESVKLHYEKARYRIELATPFSDKYAAQGALSLVDGTRGSSNFKDGHWLGFEGDDFSATIDLGSITSLDAVGISLLSTVPSWIFLPKMIAFLGSDDGVNFTEITAETLPIAPQSKTNETFYFSAQVAAKCRFVRFLAVSQGVCPTWHVGAGQKAWLFVDEVWVHEKQTNIVEGSNYDLIPKPVTLNPKVGFFYLLDNVSFSDSSFFQQYLAEKCGLKRLKTTELQTVLGASDQLDFGVVNTISYMIDSSVVFGDEGYAIDVTFEKVTIRANTPKGFFYADQTLIQLMELNSDDGPMKRLPSVHIEDSPRFAWRGMHLDESRHFFGKTFVKQYIDHLASLKINLFHWHLTDATGWRIEIKKYPKLTTVGAWRPDRTGTLYNDADIAKPNEPMTYGGFYTQDDIREIVAYAAERHITILPEIEMPGHTTAALVAYPMYSCSGGPFVMPTGAKNSAYPNFCVSNDATIQFLEDILTEVMALFPSPYIHIGGDEVERKQWKSCPRCQRYKHEHGFTTEAQLQVDFTKRIETFIRSKGRQLMGWDEIMEGGNLTTSAGVMAWRGEKLVREATAAGHEVIVTHNYYFDLYQGNPVYEPITYGYKPLKDVYQYEPVPTDLDATQKSLVRGIQGCLWSENLYNTRDVEYMLFPRLFALAEVAWSPETARNWDSFTSRLPSHLTILDQKNVNYSTAIYQPNAEIKYNPTQTGLDCQWTQQVPKGNIYYTTDGSDPTTNATQYQQPFDISDAANIKAAVYQDGKQISKISTLNYHPSLASSKPFVLKNPPSSQYNGNRPESLTDGITGTSNFRDGNWCGFYGQDFDITIDLQQVQSLQSVSISCLESNANWIYLPTKVTIETSTNGTDFTAIGAYTAAEIAASNRGRIKNIILPVDAKQARFVRIFAKNKGQHPTQPDGKCWIFIDEIQVK